MPLIDKSMYRAPLALMNGHAQTIFPTVFRKIAGVEYQRRRIPTPDGDFLDLDVSSIGARRAVILTHGLEGDSRRCYILGMARAVNRRGWDAVAWNLRGCSGEPNRRLRYYHSGDTPDLDTVVRYALREAGYERLALIGFSLGGNIVLKYLGERGEEAQDEIHAAVAFSVPCDLATGAARMALPSNILYMRRFLRLLHQKVRIKMDLFPGEIDDLGYDRIRGFLEFDGRYTAPQNGFLDAHDYWRKASSKPLLSGIAVPTLLVNARNDPLLSPECYPVDEARSNASFFLEMPRSGGHVGFVSFHASGEYWSERRAVEFLENR